MVGKWVNKMLTLLACHCDHVRIFSLDYAQVVEELVEDRELTVNNVVKKFDNYQDKIKFASFGKTKIKNVKKELY